MRSSDERFEEEVKSKFITGGHCIVWCISMEGSLLSKVTANSQSLEWRRRVAMVAWICLCSLASSWSSCWSPLSHLCCQPAEMGINRPGARRRGGPGHKQGKSWKACAAASCSSRPPRPPRPPGQAACDAHNEAPRREPSLILWNCRPRSKRRGRECAGRPQAAVRQAGGPDTLTWAPKYLNYF